MIDEKSAILEPRGVPNTALSIVLHPQVYEAVEAASAQNPGAPTVGVLIGSVAREGGREWVTLSSALPMSLHQTDSGLAVAPEDDEALNALLDSAEPGNMRVVGSFYCDPGIGQLPTLSNISSLRQVLAPNANLLLFVNPRTGEGAFGVWRNDGIKQLTGFYEVLPYPFAPSVIPWDGNWANLISGPLTSTVTTTGLSALDVPVENGTRPVLNGNAALSNGGSQQNGAALLPTIAAPAASLGAASSSSAQVGVARPQEQGGYRGGTSRPLIIAAVALALLTLMGVVGLMAVNSVTPPAVSTYIAPPTPTTIAILLPIDEPDPTYTPNPTYTPVRTYTPIVEVLPHVPATPTEVPTSVPIEPPTPVATEQPVPSPPSVDTPIPPPLPTNTPVPTIIPPTSQPTATPIKSPTPVPVPPTSTATRRPNTPVPPTNTRPQPPTAKPTNTPIRISTRPRVVPTIQVPVRTPVRPTSTRIVPTNTAQPVPPTRTATTVRPANTPSPAPPINTFIPVPTNTVAPPPEPTDPPRPRPTLPPTSPPPPPPPPPPPTNTPIPPAPPTNTARPPIDTPAVPTNTVRPPMDTPRPSPASVNP